MYFADYGSPESRKPGLPLDVTLVREFGAPGAGDSVLWFGSIRAMAARDDGSLLAVADQRNCQVVLFSPSDGAFTRAGRCGEGPGEFSRMLYRVAFLGDLVAATDEQRRTVSLFDSRGHYVRSANVADRFGASLDDVLAASESTVVGVLRHLPAGRAGDPGAPTVHLLDWRSGMSIRRGVRPPPLADSALNYRPPIATVPRACVSTTPSPRVLVVSSMWSDQLLFLSLPEFGLIANVEAPVSWKTLREREGRAEQLQPLRPPMLVCGTSHVIVANTQFAPAAPIRQFPPPMPPPPPRIVRARWDIFTYRGELLYTLVDSLPRLGPDSLLTTTPGALIGDRLYTYSNSFRGYPGVREYRIRLGASPTGGMHP